MSLDYCFVRNTLYIVRYSINYFFENSVALNKKRDTGRYLFIIMKLSACIFR